MSKYYNKPCFSKDPENPRECKVDEHCPVSWIHCRYGGNSPFLNEYRNQEEAEAYGEYKAKPRHKKIRIKTKWLQDEWKYVVLEVDALGVDDLPREYVSEYHGPCVYKDSEGDLCVRFPSRKVNYIGYVSYIAPGEEYSKERFDDIRTICDQAGKRLHEINKKRREAEKPKIETWEW